VLMNRDLKIGPGGIFNFATGPASVHKLPISNTTFEQVEGTHAADKSVLSLDYGRGRQHSHNLRRFSAILTVSD
jgi:hypothetical protein